MVHFRGEVEATEAVVREPGQREKVRFSSGNSECAAWHYPGANGGCVVMGSGMAVTKEPGTDLFAGRFHDAGFSVLAFDFRRFGESGGAPRQIMQIKEQLADWAAAIECAHTLPNVDPTKVALWGFSLSGGHVLRVAAGNPRVAAVIAQTPFTDGRAATRAATRHQKPLALLRVTGRGIVDAVGGVFGRPPRLVPLDGEPGTVAVLTSPDAGDSARALNPDNRYPDWQQAVAARSALRLGSYRPVKQASRVQCPLLVIAAEDDQAVLAAPAIRAAEKAPRGELVRVPGGHYAPFLEAHEQTVEAELSFLRRHLLDEARHTSPNLSERERAITS